MANEFSRGRALVIGVANYPRVSKLRLLRIHLWRPIGSPAISSDSIFWMADSISGSFTSVSFLPAFFFQRVAQFAQELCDFVRTYPMAMLRKAPAEAFKTATYAFFAARRIASDFLCQHQLERRFYLGIICLG